MTSERLFPGSIIAHCKNKEKDGPWDLGKRVFSWKKISPETQGAHLEDRGGKGQPEVPGGTIKREECEYPGKKGSSKRRTEKSFRLLTRCL